MIATYVYHCENCNSLFELRRDWNVRDLPAHCQICQSAQTRRVFTPVAAISRGADGAARLIGGDECGGCTASSCGGCGLAKR
jgi:putative FmdB family regulatory protein